MRILLALGGNAMSSPDGGALVRDQMAAAQTAMEAVADLVAGGVEVVVTHGNGPQVGSLLVQNEVAAHTVEPMPLDWCGAQTQGSLGFVLMNALDAALADRAVARRCAAIVTRSLVDADDPGFAEPGKPIGRFLPADQAAEFVALGQTWQDRGAKGWRRVVPSPEPREILEAPIVAALVAAGHVVIANGGGGIPVVRQADGHYRGVEAVIDKDLGAALLADAVAADMLLIATDVPKAVLRFGQPDAEELGAVSVSAMRGYAAEGHFAAGSMGPKVEAICRFVERTGRPGVITNLDSIAEAVSGAGAGTVVQPQSLSQ